MIASKAELAELLKIKLAAIPIEYTLVRELPISTPNILKLMKNSITPAKNKMIRCRVLRASPTSRIERDKNRRSLYTCRRVVLISARVMSSLSSLSKMEKAVFAASLVGNTG